MNAEIYQQVRNFFTESLKFKAGEIKPETRLLHDLQIYGEDADEIFMFLKEKHGVDFSNFNFTTYFPNEGAFTFIGLWFKDKLAKRFKPLTIADIVKAIETKKMQ